MSDKACDSPFNVWENLRWQITKARDKKKASHQEAYVTTAIGHSRHATLGNINEDNAHPFAFFNNRFVGAHNGTITNAPDVFKQLVEEEEPLPDTFEPYKDFTKKDEVTDSEIVLYCIYRWGIEKVYPLIQGAWALIWFDQSTNSIYFVRNHQRTLFYYWSVAKDTMFWSSEYMMLEFASRRELKEWDKEHCHMFNPHTLYRYDLNKHRIMTMIDKSFPWAERKSLEYLFPKPKAVSSTVYHRPSVPRGGTTPRSDAFWKEQERKRKEARGKVIVLADKSKEKSPSINAQLKKRPLIGIVHVPNSEDEDDQPNPKQCIHCKEDNVDPTNTNTFVVVKNRGRVCHKCASDFDTVEEIIEDYPETNDDPIWTNIWVSLGLMKEQEQEKKA
jgi:hypothetical protein